MASCNICNNVWQNASSFKHIQYSYFHILPWHSFKKSTNGLYYKCAYKKNTGYILMPYENMIMRVYNGLNSHNQWKTMLKICFPVMICSPFSIVCPPAPWHLFWTPPPTTMWNNIMRIVLLLCVLYLFCLYSARTIVLSYCARENWKYSSSEAKVTDELNKITNHHSQLFLLVHYLYYIHFNQNPPPHVKT